QHFWSHFVSQAAEKIGCEWDEHRQACGEAGSLTHVTANDCVKLKVVNITCQTLTHLELKSCHLESLTVGYPALVRFSPPANCALSESEMRTLPRTILPTTNGILVWVKPLQ